MLGNRINSSAEDIRVGTKSGVLSGNACTFEFRIFYLEKPKKINIKTTNMHFVILCVAIRN